MTDYTINGLTDVGVDLGLTDELEVQRNGQTGTEKAQLTRLRKLVGAGLHPGYVASNWYPVTPDTVGTPTASGLNLIKFIPFILPRPVTISDLGIRITTASAGGNIQLAIYASTTSGARKPTGVALGSTASITTATATTVSAVLAGGNITLNEMTEYWGAINADNATVVVQSIAPAGGLFSWLNGSTAMGSIANAAAVGVNFYQLTQTYGTWPDVSASSFAEQQNASSPRLLIKAV